VKISIQDRVFIKEDIQLNLAEIPKGSSGKVRDKATYPGVGEQGYLVDFGDGLEVWCAESNLSLEVV